MTLANADGYFDGMQDYQWRAGVVTLKIGVDLADADMAWADYETLATWAIQDHARDEQTFRLQLIERKARTKAKLPQSFFNRTDYPNIDEEWIGKPVPIAYGQLFGIEPVLINPGTRQFWWPAMPSGNSQPCASRAQWMSFTTEPSRHGIPTAAPCGETTCPTRK